MEMDDENGSMGMGRKAICHVWSVHIYTHVLFIIKITSSKIQGSELVYLIGNIVFKV